MINRLKVNIFDKNLIVQFKSVVSLLVGVLTTILIFKDIPQKYKNYCFIAFVILLIIIYLVLWVRSNTIKRVELNINNSKMEIEQGDIFEQDGLKVIAFNEFFDTEVSDRLISDKTLNGIYLKNIVSDVNKLDLDIENDQYLSKNIIEKNVQRAEGKSTRYELGSIYKRDDYLLTAFSKFDEYNRAYLTIKDYNNFLINFWKEIDKIYNAENISIPLLGSNITRFKECNLSDQQLLELLIWSFKLSKFSNSNSSKVSIVVHKKTMDKINLYKLKTLFYD
ncbi:macro domain-containing protein [Intestinibacter bartlettii]|uniref:macro domain-containing protein n=1 Tax=Intestinibacter bartlettii TaxID=261299 RepID=UPI002432775B|nr:macro domain-containing protein [Intestinibacter bartlettii]MDU6823465.1 DUF6430 domain-containing protein [Intestinibacter bartlettii]